MCIKSNQQQIYLVATIDKNECCRNELKVVFWAVTYSQNVLKSIYFLVITIPSLDNRIIMKFSKKNCDSFLVLQ